MSTVLNTDLFLTSRAGTNYQVTASDMAAFFAGGGAAGSDLQAAAAAPATKSDGITALTAGNVYYDTTLQRLFTYDGAAWGPIGGGNLDYQSAAAAPATRSNGQTLVEGDLYYNTVSDIIFAWSGTAWVAKATQFDWQSGAGNPTTLAVATRTSGNALVDGDLYWDSTNDVIYAWNGTQWIPTGQKRVVVTAVSTTALANDYIVVTASTKTITLPATPAVGSEVTIVVAGTFTDTVVARNGSNIMALAEDITLDKEYAAMNFTYTDATNGWRLN